MHPANSCVNTRARQGNCRLPQRTARNQSLRSPLDHFYTSHKSPHESIYPGHMFLPILSCSWNYALIYCICEASFTNWRKFFVCSWPLPATNNLDGMRETLLTFAVFHLCYSSTYCIIYKPHVWETASITRQLRTTKFRPRLCLQANSIGFNPT